MLGDYIDGVYPLPAMKTNKHALATLPIVIISRSNLGIKAMQKEKSAGKICISFHPTNE